MKHQPNFKLTPEQIQEASQLLDTVKIHAIAKRYGVTVKTLSAAMRRAGILQRKKCVRDSLQLPQDKLEQALQMHLANETLQKICDTISSSEWIVRKNLQATGQYRLKRGRKPSPEKKHKPMSLAAQFLSRPLRTVST